MKWLSGNAELQRNLWLEMTPQRLVVAPLVMALLTVLLVMAMNEPRAALLSLGSYGFVAATVLWGARLASQSLSEEFTDGTWDGQRSSGLSAAAMCAGKILGGAAFAWYIGLGCLLLFVFAASATMTVTALLKAVLGLILLALFAQALSLLSTLIAWRRLRRPADSRRRWLSLVLLIVAWQAIKRALPWLQVDGDAARQLIWFDRPWPYGDFLLVSLALFTGWALLGAHRAMRAELQFRDPPWTWIAFLLFLQVYAAGWIGNAQFDIGIGQPALLAAFGSVAVLRLLAASLLALLLAYLFVFAEAKQRLRYRRLLADLRARRVDQLLAAPPLWLVNALIAVIASLLTVAAAAVTGSDAGALLALAAGLLALLLYAVRDFAVVLWCNFGPSQRRADGAAAFYLTALYVLPMALLMAARLGAWSGLVSPMASFDNPLWLLPALAWAAAGIALLARRWRAGNLPD